MKRTSWFILSLLLLVEISFSQPKTIENESWKVSLGKKGVMHSLTFQETQNTFLFHQEGIRGPSWYIQRGDEVIVPGNIRFSNNKWITSYDRVDYSFEYKEEDGRLLLLATIRSRKNVPFQPDKIGIRLGINTYMDQYPDWEKRVFPTLLRCEKTHFWGYLMSPPGKILMVASPDPIASWSHNYSKSWGAPLYRFWGHRIQSVNLDLVNALPLPERHPQHLYQIMPGETKTFRIYLDEAKSLDNVVKSMPELTGAPSIDMRATSCKKEESMEFKVYSVQKPYVTVVSPKGKEVTLKAMRQGKGMSHFRFGRTGEEGRYTIYAEANGKTSEALFYVRKNYSWYMQQAMKAVVEYPQKASLSHCESWYGFYTAFAGGKYFPGNEYVKEANTQFEKILPLVFDTTRLEPYRVKNRIQNVSSIIGILVDRYQLYHEKKDLDMAVGFSDYLLDAQSPDGAYRSHQTHYTSVIYIAKSLMELLEVLERDEERYREAYTRIYASVKSAIDELERNKTNIQTEGEQTFEDGMIACTALQLARFALVLENPGEKQKYIRAASDVLEQHRCLDQLVIPDARMRGGTLRFWEAQYDVMMNNNFFNSPHGWSSWTTYATYYLYLLTGETSYLVRTFNGLDAAMQMIDFESGELYWAFMVNPSVEVVQINRNLEGAIPLDVQGIHYHAKANSHEKYRMGEAYVDMVSDWFFANANDNDVHEHFKCLEEVALNKAYVAEKEDGGFLAYNCQVNEENGTLVVSPAEALVEKVHLNLKDARTVNILFSSGNKKVKVDGMVWVTHAEDTQ